MHFEFFPKNIIDSINQVLQKQILDFITLPVVKHNYNKFIDFDDCLNFNFHYFDQAIHNNNQVIIQAFINPSVLDQPNKSTHRYQHNKPSWFQGRKNIIIDPD